MKSTAFALLSFLTAAPLLHAADVEVAKPDPGAPGHPAEPQSQPVQVFRVAPTPSQTEEVEALHTLTLTDEQWQEIRKYLPETPKRIDPVLTAETRTQSKAPFPAICEKDGRITLSGYSGGVACAEYAAALFSQNSVTLSVDRRGQFYFRGVLIPYDELVAATHNCPPAKSGQKKTARILIPAVATPGDKTLHPHLREIYTAFADHGWNGGKLPADFPADPGQ